MYNFRITLSERKRPTQYQSYYLLGGSNKQFRENKFHDCHCV